MIYILVGLLALTAIALVPYIIGKITSVGCNIDIDDFWDFYVLGFVVIIGSSLFLSICYLLGSILLGGKLV